MPRRESVMLCLIACGETVWDADGRVLGASDLPLSDAGRAAVQNSVQHLAEANPSVIYHPGDEAAVETASILANLLSARTRNITELADPHLGILEGVTEQEFAERYPKRYKQWETDPTMLAAPDGEEMVHAADRLLRAVARILKRSRSEEVGIVLHRLGHAMLRCWLHGQSLQQMRQMMQAPPVVERHPVRLDSLASLENAASELLASR